MAIFESLWRKRGRPKTYGSEVLQPPAKPAHKPSHRVTMTDRDYSSLTHQKDVAVKFWLPELLGSIMDETCSVLKETRSDLVRQLLFSYLYGCYDWLGLYERGIDDHEMVSGPAFSVRQLSAEEAQRKEAIARELGKNIEDLKVWVPLKIKEDISTLADKAGLSCSEMIREIILSSLIGHTYMPARNELMQLRIELEDKTEVESEKRGYSRKSHIDQWETRSDQRIWKIFYNREQGAGFRSFREGL